MNLLIAGSRTIKGPRAYQALVSLMKCFPHVHSIISGGARGVDALGEYYAEDNYVHLRIFPVDWDVYGKGAGYIRNQNMVREADAALFLWDGSSKGTKHSISLAQDKAIPYIIAIIQNNTIISYTRYNMEEIK